MVHMGVIRGSLRIPYALRRVPEEAFSQVIPIPEVPLAGDIVLARLEKIGKNARLELASGRPCTLHRGDLLAVVFGNRYATNQFEGYARRSGDSCDLLSMGGLCGLVESRHAGIPEPNRLSLLGALADPGGRMLRLADYSLGLAVAATSPGPRVVAVCGSSMDAGKTYTAMSLIRGLRRQGARVAGMKLTGTAAGRDTWSMLDAGAVPALDFTDGGYPSTFLLPVDEILDLFQLLLSQASAQRAEWVVVEIADGLLERETSALLQNRAFVQSVDAWVFAAGDPLSAEAGVRRLRGWNIEPVAISGLVSMSPLGMREVQEAVGLSCTTSEELQAGSLNPRLCEAAEARVAVEATCPARIR